MKEWIMVLKAADAAARWHIDQRRKGAAKEPYINHLLEVASLVASATEGKDPNLVIAALLHDAIEDCEVPHEMIAETFGTDVADLVAEVTDDKSLPKAERKQLQEETAPTKSPRAKVLKLADKISSPSKHGPLRETNCYRAAQRVSRSSSACDRIPSLALPSTFAIA
jgi:(p)ppGpp synthase/HD superfamily hydrolase